MRFIVSGIVSDMRTQDEVATVTVTIDADDDGDAQTKCWELFDESIFSFDTTEIEEAS